MLINVFNVEGDCDTGKRFYNYLSVEMNVSKGQIEAGAKRVPLKIGIMETALQEQVRAVGGRWNKQQQAWLVSALSYLPGNIHEARQKHCPMKPSHRRSGKKNG